MLVWVKLVAVEIPLLVSRVSLPWASAPATTKAMIPTVTISRHLVRRSGDRVTGYGALATLAEWTPHSVSQTSRNGLASSWDAPGNLHPPVSRRVGRIDNGVFERYIGVSRKRAEGPTGRRETDNMLGAF